MGINSSILTPQDLERLKKETDIKGRDIKKFHKKFKVLDKDKKGYVSVDDLVHIPEIEQNPLNFYIAKYLTNGNDKEAISFEAFIKVIDIFKNNKIEEQYQFMFNLFDFDKDGKISNEDMIVNFGLLLGNSLNKEQIGEIVDKTIAEFAEDKKSISYKDFVRILNES